VNNIVIGARANVGATINNATALALAQAICAIASYCSINGVNNATG
jgi:hypothetical protein